MALARNMLFAGLADNQPEDRSMYDMMPNFLLGLLPRSYLGGYGESQSPWEYGGYGLEPPELPDYSQLLRQDFGMFPFFRNWRKNLGSPVSSYGSGGYEGT
jgi:hypothetical protein